MNLIVKIIISILVALLLILLLVRLLSARHFDDLHPNIPCDEKLIKKSDILYVIPIFDNISIADNLGWCAKILSYNKTLAMHGVYHNYNEFLTYRSEAYLENGAEEFSKCFGFYPTRFKPPQGAISPDNKKIIIKEYELDTWFINRFHKLKHCNDQGMFPNWISDLI
mgnify:FL=1